MNEMICKENTTQGGSVKKSLLVLAIAAILVFAFAGSAFAVNHSGQQRLGSAYVTGAPVGGIGSNPADNVAGAGTFTYMDWSTGLGTNNQSTSPHGAYTTTTVKCVVCHSVHYAAAGGPVNGSQTADTLLRMKASQACAFCHVTAGQTVNGKPVYDGVVPVLSGGSQNSGHAVGTNCDECHTSVHGVGADGSVAALNGYLLKTQLVTPHAVSPTGTVTTDMITSINAIDTFAVSQGFASGAALGYTPAAFANTANTDVTYRRQAIGVFCAECHNGSYASATAGAATNVALMGANGSGMGITSGAPFTGHRVMAPAGSNWNGPGNVVSSSAKTGLTVAWAAATDCTSCHDAKDSYGNPAFPHSWGGTKMWLMSAASSIGAKSALPYGTAAGSGYSVASGGSAPQLSDGVCLKCHADGVSAGVGLTY